VDVRDFRDASISRLVSAYGEVRVVRAAEGEVESGLNNEVVCGQWILRRLKLDEGGRARKRRIGKAVYSISSD